MATPSRSASPAKSPPASAARVPVAAYRSRTLVAASDQPSEAARRYRDQMARIAVAPSILVSIQPYGSATCVEPSSARAEATSRSGLGPAATRRNTLKMAASPNTRLVLLCSPVSTRLSSPGAAQDRSAPGTRQNRSGPTDRSAASAPSRVRVRSLSCSPS